MIPGISAIATNGTRPAIREFRKWVRLDRIDTGTQILYKFHYRDSIKKCTECDYDFVHTDSVVGVSPKGDTTFATECYLDSLKNLMCQRALPFPLGTVFRSSDSLAGGMVVTDSSLVGFAYAKTSPVPIYGGTSYSEYYVVKGVGLIYSTGRSSGRFAEVKRKWTLLQHDGKPFQTAAVLGRLQALPGASLRLPASISSR